MEKEMPKEVSKAVLGILFHFPIVQIVEFLPSKFDYKSSPPFKFLPI